jgi:hypothetical protein
MAKKEEGKLDKTVEKTTEKSTNGKLTQRTANQRASLLMFKILYNEGKEWPAQLYQKEDGSELSDADKTKMHQAYLKNLVSLAKRGGKNPVTQTSVVFD